MAYEVLRQIPDTLAEDILAELSKDDKTDVPAETGAPDDDKPHPDTEMTDIPGEGVKGDGTTTPPAETRDKSDDETTAPAETANSQNDHPGGLDGSSDRPDKPIPIDLTRENDDTPKEAGDNPQDAAVTPKDTKTAVKNLINNFKKVVTTPAKDAKKTHKSSKKKKKKKKSGKKPQKVDKTPQKLKDLKRKRIEEPDEEEELDEEEVSDEESESDQKQTPAGRKTGQVGNKQPIMTNPRPTPPGGPRHKR
jgi:hypothetical protein